MKVRTKQEIKVLDTVLTTKSLYCAKNNITFTCVADGALLDFYGRYGYLQYFWKCTG